MVKDVPLPEISENVSSGEVINVLVGVGDTVSKEQTVVEVETEKAAVGIPTPYEGQVSEVLVKVGDTVNVGQPLIKLDTDSEELQKATSQVKHPRSQTQQVRSASVPEAGELSRSTIKPKIKQAPTLTEVTEPAENPSSIPESPATEKTKEKIAVQFKLPAPAAPSVRRLARELGADIEQVKGSGTDGRISAEDVKNYTKAALYTIKNSARGTHRPGVQLVSDELPDFEHWGNIYREPLSKVRLITAEAMSHAWQTIPHVTQFDQADITLLNQFKARYEKQVAEAGGKLTVTAILIKVVSVALKKFTQFNVSLDIKKQEQIYKEYVNIGIAVDTDRGLMVPVIKHADQKSLIDVAVEITTLADKVRHKRLGLDELKGGNFTISNLGGIGGTQFTPIVNWPEVAILGVSRADWQPRYGTGNGNAVGGLEPRFLLPLSLSYDHRVIDGALGARFLRWLAEALEDPYLLMM